MMIGAIGWGSCSDLLGRSTAFNLTLCFTAVFGLVASYAPTYSALCIALFFLGTSVGGSMPTDGTLLLEHMPQGKKYLVTALSVFFSFGSVLSAVVGIIVIPPYSCSPNAPGRPPCNVETGNQGWKYLLISVGLITLTFFLARIVFFRLHESPRFLVHAGRPEEALLSLKKITQYNGSELSLTIHDVDDRRPSTPPQDEREPFVSAVGPRPQRTDVRLVFDATEQDEPARMSSETDPLALEAAIASATARRQSDSPEIINYDSTGSSNTPLGSHSFVTPVASRANSVRSIAALQSTSLEDEEEEEDAEAVEDKTRSLLNRRRPRASTTLSRRSSLYEAQVKVCWALPGWIRRPLWAWLDRISVVLSPEWLRTTLLVWAMWCTMALAYTMFNVFLPKMLEMSPGGAAPDGTAGNTLEGTMWDVVIFTIGGCPGAILGAYMVESSLGKRWSLAGSTFVTALFCLAFVFSESSLAVRVSTIGISLSSTTMWAILYGWTPDIFETTVRGTACGTASALSRVGGMIAPVLGGALLVAGRALPLYVSTVVFVIAGFCTLLLRVEEGDRIEGSTMAH